MLEPQFAATSRMVCKSTHLVPLNTQREALSRPPGCRSACSKWWCSCRGLVGKTWIDSRETRQTPAPCSMSNCTAPGPGVQSRRFASGSNLPDGIFSGRSATGDGAALSVENGRRSDGCRPPTQTASGMYRWIFGQGIRWRSLPHMCATCSVVAPGQPGAARRNRRFSGG